MNKSISGNAEPGKQVSVFRNRNYVLLILSEVCNRFGDSVDAVVFSWLAYTVTGSAGFSAMVFAANRLPTVLFQPITGVIIEKRRKRLVMATADFARALLTGYIFVRLVTGKPLPVEIIIVTLLISTVECFRQPAGASILPSVVREEQYTKAVSYQQGFNGGAELAGMGASGFLIAVLGNTGTIAIVSGLFVLSGVLLLLLRNREKVNPAGERLSVFRITSDLKDGFSIVRKNSVILYLVIVSVVLNSVATPYNSLESAAVREILHSDTEMLSLLGVTLGGGTIMGATLYPKIREIVSLKVIFAVSTPSIALLYIGTVFAGSVIKSGPWLYILEGIFMFTAGFALAVLGVFSSVSIMQKCDREYLSRVNGILGSVRSAAIPVISVVISGLSGFISTGTIFLVSGILTVVSGLIVFSKRVMPEEIREELF